MSEEVKWNVYPREFREQNTLEGKALIMGPGFDYQSMILFDHDTQELVIRYARPRTPDEEGYPYPAQEEMTVPLALLKKIIP